jgi:hypothetical protein
VADVLSTVCLHLKVARDLDDGIDLVRRLKRTIERTPVSLAASMTLPGIRKLSMQKSARCGPDQTTTPHNVELWFYGVVPHVNVFAKRGSRASRNLLTKPDP